MNDRWRGRYCLDVLVDSPEIEDMYRLGWRMGRERGRHESRMGSSRAVVQCTRAKATRRKGQRPRDAPITVDPVRRWRYELK